VKRAHVLDPSVQPWVDDVPKGSKWYIVFRGHSPGLYSEHNLVNLKLCNFSNGSLQEFPDKADAI